jgi:hypothetical protein
MADLSVENPAATHFVFIAASGQPGRGRWDPLSGYAWWVLSPNAQRVQGGNSTLNAPVDNWHTTAAVQAAVEAVTQSAIAARSHLHFVSTLEYLTNLLNEDRSVRKEDDYLRKDLTPLADEEQLRVLDAKFEELDLTVTAGPPRSRIAGDIFQSLKGFTSVLGRNADNPDDWTGQLAEDLGPKR